MDYYLKVRKIDGGWKAELFNEFDRLVSWNWAEEINSAILEAVTWQIKHSPGDTRSIIKALLNAEIEENPKEKELKP